MLPGVGVLEERRITAITETTMTLDGAALPATAGDVIGATIRRLRPNGKFDGVATLTTVGASPAVFRTPPPPTLPGFLSDGFLEGQ